MHLYFKMDRQVILLQGLKSENYSLKQTFATYSKALWSFELIFKKWLKPINNQLIFILNNIDIIEKQVLGDFF